MKLSEEYESGYMSWKDSRERWHGLVALPWIPTYSWVLCCLYCSDSSPHTMGNQIPTYISGSQSESLSHHQDQHHLNVSRKAAPSL